MKLKLRTDTDQLTYKEIVLFQQYFWQIIKNFDVLSFTQLKEKVFELLNNNKPIQASHEMREFEQKIMLQEFGSDAWMICYAILIEKDEPIFESSKLIELYNKKAIKKKESEIKEPVENFLQAFPILWSSYQLRMERLSTLTDLFFNKD